MNSADSRLRSPTAQTTRKSHAGRRPNSAGLSLEKTKIDLPGSYLIPAEDGIAVVKVPSFRKGASRQISKIFKELEGSKVERVVLDLRGNAWGEPEEAIRAASVLAGEGIHALRV